MKKDNFKGNNHSQLFHFHVYFQVLAEPGSGQNIRDLKDLVVVQSSENGNGKYMKNSNLLDPSSAHPLWRSDSKVHGSEIL